MKLVKHFVPREGMSVTNLVEQMMGMGLGARELGKALDVMRRMRSDGECVKFLGVAGAVIPGGLRETISHMIKVGCVDALVTTGAGLTHDLLEAIGERPLVLTRPVPDAKLEKSDIHRIYNIAVRKRSYLKLEHFVKEFLSDIPDGGYAPHELARRLGSVVDDENSILRASHKVGAPVYCPGLADSVLGSQLWAQSSGRVSVDVLGDVGHIVDTAWSLKRTGAVFVGGGVPKHFIFLAVLTASKPLSYAVQITLDRPEHGGLSGAKLQEAVSWRKLRSKAATADLVCDASIALPLLITALETSEKDIHT